MVSISVTVQLHAVASRIWILACCCRNLFHGTPISGHVTEHCAWQASQRQQLVSSDDRCGNRRRARRGAPCSLGRSAIRRLGMDGERGGSRVGWRRRQLLKHHCARQLLMIASKIRPLTLWRVQAPLGTHLAIKHGTAFGRFKSPASPKSVATNCGLWKLHVKITTDGRRVLISYFQQSNAILTLSSSKMHP